MINGNCIAQTNTYEDNYYYLSIMNDRFWVFYGTLEGGNARNWIKPASSYVTVERAKIKHKEIVKKYNDELLS